MEGERDLYILQETGKIVVNDTEEQSKKLGEQSDDDDEPAGTRVAKKGSSARQIKKDLKVYNL